MNPEFAVGTAVAFAVLLVTFVKTDAGLVILIFSMLLSPEISVAEVPHRSVVIRLDDFLVAAVFLGWIAKMAVNKELGLVKKTRLNLPIGAYIGACVISTALGIAAGRVNTARAFFYIVKYVEYFLVFFVFANNISSRKQIVLFLAAFMATGGIIVLHGYYQIFEGALRISAPFEGAHGEPNTLGGYLLLLIAVSFGIYAFAGSVKTRFASAALAFAAMPPLAATLSRSSYIGLLPMLLALFLLCRRGRFLCSCMLVVVVITAVVSVSLPYEDIAKVARAGEFKMLPLRVLHRIRYTFSAGHEYRLMGARLQLEESAAARVESSKEFLKKWTDKPVLGYGTTGMGFIDSQYVRVLAESGVLGVAVFLWVIVTVYRLSASGYVHSRDAFYKGLTAGYIAGLTGLLVHGLTANTFIIVRIMEPFWFLTAVIVAFADMEGQGSSLSPQPGETTYSPLPSQPAGASTGPVQRQERP